MLKTTCSYHTIVHRWQQKLQLLYRVWCSTTCRTSFLLFHCSDHIACLVDDFGDRFCRMVCHKKHSNCGLDSSTGFDTVSCNGGGICQCREWPHCCCLQPTPDARVFTNDRAGITAVLDCWQLPRHQKMNTRSQVCGHLCQQEETGLKKCCSVPVGFGLECNWGEVW